MDILRLLLDMGFNQNETESEFLTPLMTAARDGNLEAFRVLLERGAHVSLSRTDENGKRIGVQDIIDRNLKQAESDQQRTNYQQIGALLASRQ